jgi:formate dehydrogenase major subunit
MLTDSRRDRGPLRPWFSPTPERTTPNYPLLLITGRSLYEFNAGTMTGRSRTRELRPADLLEISSEDAAKHGVADGELVGLVSRYGATAIRAHISARMRAGELFATFHTASTFLNAVTGSRTDPATGTPEYKVTAVRIQKQERK